MLRGMLEKDGYTEEEVEKIVAMDNKRYRDLTERALCRLFTYGEGRAGQSNLFLLPWCIDKWRQYVKERKVFKYWISYLEQRRNRNEMKEAFEAWATAI